jgi:hypothetical protein
MAAGMEDRIVALRGWAAFAWQADYGQFYLIDCEDAAFRPPTDITAEMELRRVFVPPTGIVIYTEGYLQQHIRIAIHDTEPEHAPEEPMSGKPWTRVETVAARFPSRKLTIASPSMPDPLPAGPVFFLDAAAVTARIAWMEFQGSRDDSVPVEPDVIEIAFWVT